MARNCFVISTNLLGYFAFAAEFPKETLTRAPQQSTAYVEIDTGSDQLWVNPNCSTAPTELCQQQLCESIPRYGPIVSSTAKGPSGSSRILYGGLGEELTGVEIDYYSDTVSINGVGIDGQDFGVATASLGLPGGILGLGPSLKGFAINESYPRVIDSLFQQGSINSRAYSLHLGSAEDYTGSLILGGLDRGKFIGSLQKLPIVVSKENVTRLTINYDSLARVSPINATKQYTLNDTNVLLDSKTTFIKLEASVVQETYTDLSVTVDGTTGYPIINCSARSWPGGFSLSFGKKSIVITYRDLIFTSDGLCALGIQAIGAGGQQVLGIPFLRAAYVVYDFDNQNIHLGQAGNCAKDLVSIGLGPGALPNVTGSCDTVPTPSSLTNIAGMGPVVP